MTNTFIRVATVLLISIAAAACAKPGPLTTRRNRDLISRAQIEALPVNDAYAIIERLRPEFLRERGTGTLQITAQAVVYVDGLRQGGPSVLRSIRSSDVQEIRFVSSTDAVTRYGMDHPAGAIEVKTRQGGRD